MGFAFCHASSLRRLCFSIKEQFPKAFREKSGVTFGGGYGTPNTFKGGDINIGCAISSKKAWTTVESCEQYILEQLQKQGVELDD